MKKADELNVFIAEILNPVAGQWHDLSTDEGRESADAAMNIADGAEVAVVDVDTDALDATNLSYPQLVEVGETIEFFSMEQLEALEALCNASNGTASDVMEIVSHVDDFNFAAVSRALYGDDLDAAIGKYLVFDCYPLDTDATILGQDITTFLDFAAIGEAARCNTSMANYSHTTATHHYFIN